MLTAKRNTQGESEQILYINLNYTYIQNKKVVKQQLY